MLRETTGVALEQALRALALRQEAIADNIANAETPGHRPRRVMFEDALRRAIWAERHDGDNGLRQPEVERTAPSVLRQPISQTSAVAVDMESEMTQLAIASAHYEAVARTLAKRYRMLRTAITGGAQS